MPLFVFPEGSRTPDGDLQTFLAGAAFLAIRAQVPLVPVALSGGYDLLPIHTRHFYPGELVMTVGKPIETTGMTPRRADELTERLRCTIAEMLGHSLQGRAIQTAGVPPGSVALDRMKALERGYRPPAVSAYTGSR